ncbi:unnamed protein product [Protopolystoma xenopodis]|uniref:Uncharacterized protein n=1 Tax=Protopolystoma xenopodis TaxID=117903 RepID=A0A3S5CL76_9PLAT|nr:unnamed protein product [Protopolystoma xenopodis]
MLSLASGGSSNEAILGFRSIVQLSWALTIRKVAQLQAELIRQRQADPVSSSLQSPNDIDISDEQLANIAIDNGALEFLRLIIDLPECEPLWTRRLHGLITDLIVLLPMRVREIRLRDEELARRTGMDPSADGRGFANLLLLIGDIYSSDQSSTGFGNPHTARLTLSYWWSAGSLLDSQTDAAVHASVEAIPNQSRLVEVDRLRQSALFRFVRSASDFVSSSCLYVPYLHMLRGLVCTQRAADLCFKLLSVNASGAGKLFECLKQYTRRKRCLFAK